MQGMELSVMSRFELGGVVGPDMCRNDSEQSSRK
jgi:hypothetical protein